MRKAISLAAACLLVGVLLGYGFQARAAPATTCSQAAATRFLHATLGQGRVAVAPAGCENLLISLAFNQLYRTNAHWQSLNTSVASLQGKLNFICGQNHLSGC